MRTPMLVAFLLIVFPMHALAASLADHIPDDVLTCVTWRGADALNAEYQGTHLQGIVKAANLGPVFSETIPNLIAKASENNPQAHDAAQTALQIAAILWKHPGAYCFESVDFSNPKNPQPEAAALCDAGADAPHLVELIKKAIASAAPLPPDAPPINVHAAGGLVILTLGKVAPNHAAFFGEGVQDAPDNAPIPKALFASTRYIDALKESQTPDNAAYVVYVDVAAIVKTVDAASLIDPDPSARTMWPKVRDALNLSTFTTAVCSGGFSGKDWGQQAFIGMGDGRNGIATLLNSPPLSDAAIKAIPQDAVTATVFAFDVGKALQEARRVVGAIDQNALHQFDQTLAQASAGLGVDVVADLIDPLGSEWTYYSTGQVITAGALPVSLSNMNLVNHLQDPVKLTATMAKLEALASQKLEAGGEAPQGPGLSLHLKTAQLDGVDVHYLVTGFVTPSWAIDHGNLIVSLQPRDAVAAATQASAPKTSLLDNEGFSAISKRLAVPKPSALQYVDLPKTAPAAYQTVQQILGYLQIAHVVEIDPTVMPALEDILPNLAPAGSMAWTDTDGWHSRGISPFPGSELFGGQANIGAAAPMAGLMAAILIPSLGRAREMAVSAVDAANLTGIAKGCALYSAENADKFPDHLAQLIAEGMISPKQLVDKSSGTPPLVLTPDMDAAMKKDWHAIQDAVDEHCDYVYVGAGMKENVDSTVVIAYDKESHRDGRNVAFEDAHVEFIKNSDINKVFDASNKAAPNPLLKPLSDAELGNPAPPAASMP